MSSRREQGPILLSRCTPTGPHSFFLEDLQFESFVMFLDATTCKTINKDKRFEANRCFYLHGNISYSNLSCFGTLRNLRASQSFLNKKIKLLHPYRNNRLSRTVGTYMTSQPTSSYLAYLVHRHESLKTHPYCVFFFQGERTIVKSSVQTPARKVAHNYVCIFSFHLVTVRS